MYALLSISYRLHMQNSIIMPGKIRNEAEYNEASTKLKSIYREIMKLVISKEEYEEQIQEYLKQKSNS